jgi:hypothetical protein
MLLYHTSRLLYTLVSLSSNKMNLGGIRTEIDSMLKYWRAFCMFQPFECLQILTFLVTNKQCIFAHYSLF